MPKIVWNGRLWLAAAAVSLLAVPVPPAVGAPTVIGDRAAWAEMVTAVRKMGTLSYREKATMPGVTTAIKEFVPPNSRHVIAQFPGGGGREEIVVGNEMWSRKPGDKWPCVPAKATAGLLPALDVENLDAEVFVTRIQDLVIDGMPTRGYNYVLIYRGQVQSYTVNNRLYIGVRTGLPRRAVLDKTGVTRDFYDYGAKITITLPPCN